MRANRTPGAPERRLLDAITVVVIAGLAVASALGGVARCEAQEIPLQNPGFETGDLSGWTTWGEVSGVQRSEQWFGSIPAHSGLYFLGTATSGGIRNGGVYQQVSVEPNATHSVAVWYYIYWIGGSYDSRECWLGFDPHGGTSPDSDSVIWAGPGTDTAPYGEGGWKQLRLDAVQAGPTGTITIFLKHVQMTAEAWNINCFDDASLDQTGAGHGLEANFSQGWNLISLPLDPADPDPEVVFADCIAAGNAIQGNLWRYHPATGYEVYPLHFSQLEVNRAYWLHLENDCAIELYGGLIFDQSVTLDHGWNFVGFPYFEPISLLDISVCNAAACADFPGAAGLGWLERVLYYYAGGYQAAGFDPWHSDQSLRPFKGYWVHSTVDGLRIEFRPLCSDGTPYGECSLTRPLYCDNGELVDNCHVCRCDLGSVCLADVSCVTPDLPPGKSKLSIHTGFGGPYSMPFVEGAHPTVVKILDSFEYADNVKTASPETKVVGRIYLPDQPMDGDPVVRASEWWDKCKSKILQYPDVDYWEGYNEPSGVGNAQAMAWYATFEQTRVNTLAQHNRKACIGSFGTGGITPPEVDPSMWEAFAPAIDAAIQNGGVLGLHEYGCPMGCTFDTDTGEGLLCGRYRKVYRDYLIPSGRAIPLVITESGVDAVGNVSGCCNCWGWRMCYTWEEYRDQLIWYDSILREDDYVIGMTLFALEIPGWETFDIGDPDLMAWLTSHVAGGG